MEKVEIRFLVRNVGGFCCCCFWDEDGCGSNENRSIISALTVNEEHYFLLFSRSIER